MPQPTPDRTIVSYVRRSPRMNDSQHRALARLSGTYVVAPGTVVDWDAEFGRPAPLVAEIGSGTGESLTAMAAARPTTNIVAFEVYQRAVASSLLRLSGAGVRNVRMVMADGVQGLEHLVAPGGLAELWTFFPDPWHKSRHHKRRLVNPRFAALVATRLAPGGLWRLATDWPAYAQWMRNVLDATPALVNAYGDAPGGWAPRPDDRPITRFEARGLAAGRPIVDLVYRRRP